VIKSRALRLGLVLALLVGLLAGVPAWGDLGPIEIELTPTEITVGDRVEATLKLHWHLARPGIDTQKMVWSEQWGGAEVLEVGEIETSTDPVSGHAVWAWSLTLTAFEPGEVRLPSIPVNLEGDGQTFETSTVETAFTVVSVLPEEGEEPLEPRALAPPLARPGGAAFWWSSIVLTGLCAFLGTALARRLATVPGAAEPARLLAPFDEFIAGLGRLDPTASGEVLHTGLSAGLRHYLGRSLGMNALESTTSEIQRRLRTTSVPSGTAAETVRLLRDCDQVKFGRFEVDAALNRERLRSGREVARKLEVALRPPEPPPGETYGSRPTARPAAAGGRR